MARLDSSLGSPGTWGRFTHVKSGTDSYKAYKGETTAGAVYPDSSSNVDIVKSNFGIPNTFYFRFSRNGNLSQFQIMYRYRKRYSPSAAWAIDDSGGNVWTDWTDWTTEKGTVDDPGEEVATVNFSVDAAAGESGTKGTATWQKAFSHKYSEIDEYDRVVYQFRVRVYNSVANTCGKWWQCELPVNFVPAITGLTVTKRADGGFGVSVQTNYQRRVRAYLAGSVYYQGSYTRTITTDVIAAATADPDALAFTIPAKHIKNGVAYIRDSYITPEDVYCERGLSCTWQPAVNEWSGYFTPQSRVEPTLPEPTITTDTASRNLQVYVVSSGDNYTDVQGSAGWTDLSGEERDEPLSFAYDSSTKRWVANYWLPPLDTPMDVRVAIVGDDWKAYKVEGVTVPSDGCICFDRTLAHDRARTVRLKYNQSVTLSDEVAGETVECVGREFPVSRYGGVKTRTIKLDASYIHTDFLGGNGWKNSVECLTQANDWVLRIPGGEVYRVMVSSLDRSTEAPTNGKLMDVSITCEVVGYDVS